MEALECDSEFSCQYMPENGVFIVTIDIPELEYHGDWEIASDKFQDFISSFPENPVIKVALDPDDISQVVEMFKEECLKCSELA